MRCTYSRLAIYAYFIVLDKHEKEVHDSKSKVNVQLKCAEAVDSPTSSYHCENPDEELDVSPIKRDNPVALINRKSNYSSNQSDSFSAARVGNRTHKSDSSHKKQKNKT